MTFKSIEKSGFIYIMSNKCMPGIIKVGMSTRNPILRINDDDLNSTGVPTKFIVEFSILFEDMRLAEKKSHKYLSKFHYSKEFFKVNISTAINIIKKIDIKSIVHYINPCIDNNISRTPSNNDNKISKIKYEGQEWLFLDEIDKSWEKAKEIVININNTSNSNWRIPNGSEILTFFRCNEFPESIKREYIKNNYFVWVDLSRSPHYLLCRTGAIVGIGGLGSSYSSHNFRIWLIRSTVKVKNLSNSSSSRIESYRLPISKFPGVA